MNSPKSGEFWQAEDGSIAYIIGVKLDGEVMWHGIYLVPYNGGEDWEDWQHLPDCTGFDWKPKPKTRTVTLRRWIAWDDVGTEVELWRVHNPDAWKHYHDTGETKTVEVPNE